MLSAVDQHIYGGKYFRPAPVLVPQDDQDRLLILTLWGQAEPAIDSMVQALSAAHPAEVLMDLHKGLLTSHQGMVGAEALILKWENRLLEWAGCGQPALFLKHQGQTLTLHQQVDFNYDSSPEPQTPPLPSSLLGVEDAPPHFSAGSFKLQKGMDLVSISRSWVPASATEHITDKSQCINALASDSEDMPFWWCHLQISL